LGFCRFQSTPSGGKATIDIPSIAPGQVLFQSTPSGGKATNRASDLRTIDNVSIHAFRGEGDFCRSVTRQTRRRFNPRLPGGRRPHTTRRPWRAWRFQSTPSGGKATTTVFLSVNQRIVSIHAFRGEGDDFCCGNTSSARSFNPRLPGGRRH